LGHWVKIRKNRIDTYQIITPTAWNASPVNGQGHRGPWEQALVGTAIADPADPVEAELVIRSFDPCLVCTVHAADIRGAGV
jgi:hydrogenase large subunit